MVMDVRHVKINNNLSIIVSCGRVTINAGHESDNTGLSFTLPNDVSEAILERSDTDEQLTCNCYPIAMLLRGLDLTLTALLYSAKSPEEFQESYETLSRGLENVNRDMICLMQARQGK